MAELCSKSKMAANKVITNLKKGFLTILKKSVVKLSEISFETNFVLKFKLNLNLNFNQNLVFD